jgi:hypothetical protein
MFRPIADRGTPQRLETLGTDMLVRKAISKTFNIYSRALSLLAFCHASHDAQCHADRFGLLFSFKSYLALND